MLNFALFSRSIEFWMPAPIENFALFSRTLDFWIPAPIENLARLLRSREFWIPAPIENLARFSTIWAGTSAANDDDGDTIMTPAKKAAAIYSEKVI